MLTVGSLFSGIGGIDLGLEWTGGFKTIWFVENDKYCQKVLAKHWPEVPCYGDIKEVDFTSLPRPDLLCGGFPCQPFSVAGKRKGTADNRWLWPEFYRAICEIKPRWVLVENVPGLLSIASGRIFGGILRDLAESGYDAEWDVLSAAQFGAPHLRFRVFLVAHSISAVSWGRTVFGNLRNGGWGTGEAMAEGIQPNHRETCADYFKQTSPDVVNPQQCGCSGEPRLADSDGKTWETAGSASKEIFRPETKQRLRRCGGSMADPQQCGCSGDGYLQMEETADVADSTQFMPGYGYNGNVQIFKPTKKGRKTRSSLQSRDWWSVEPDVGRVAHGIPSRVDRLKSLGNAVVPACAEFIGERILEVEKGGG